MYRFLIFILVVAELTISCSKLILVQEPEMRVLGGKTLIEAQVLGRYRTIDETAYQISTLSSGTDLSLISVSTNVSDETANTYKQAIIRSMFNEDEINIYKDTFYIGENNKGYLEYIASGIVSNQSAIYSAERIKYIKELITKENEDRYSIAVYIIMSDKKLDLSNIKEVENAMYRRNIERLRYNTYYQLPDNQWALYTNTITNNIAR